jgi:hypothetical protein
MTMTTATYYDLATAAAQLAITPQEFADAAAAAGIDETDYTEEEISVVAATYYEQSNEANETNEVNEVEEVEDFLHEDFHHVPAPVHYYASPKTKAGYAIYDMRLEAQIDAVQAKLAAYRRLEPGSSMIPQIENDLQSLLARRYTA